jgi:hypothetical protein
VGPWPNPKSEEFLLHWSSPASKSIREKKSNLGRGTPVRCRLPSSAYIVGGFGRGAPSSPAQEKHAAEKRNKRRRLALSFSFSQTQQQSSAKRSCRILQRKHAWDAAVGSQCSHHDTCIQSVACIRPHYIHIHTHQVIFLCYDLNPRL